MTLYRQNKIDDAILMLSYIGLNEYEVLAITGAKLLGLIPQIKHHAILEKIEEIRMILKEV